MDEKIIAILNILVVKPLRFEPLFEEINKTYSLHRDGLESILQVMTKEKFVVVKHEVWSVNKWPDKKAA